MLWIVDSSSVDVPSLVRTVVALPPDDVSVVGVGSSVNIEASVSKISDSSGLSSEPSDLLEKLVLEWSGNSCISVVVPVVSSELDGDDLVSVRS